MPKSEPATLSTWPLDAPVVRPPRYLVVRRISLFAGLGIAALGMLWLYRVLSTSPFLAVEVLPLPLAFWAFAMLCVNEYVAVTPKTGWAMVRVMRRTVIGLLSAVLVTVLLHILDPEMVLPFLPWGLGLLFLALVAFLVLGAWWWLVVRYEYTDTELLWADGFWGTQRWRWTEVTAAMRDSQGEGGPEFLRLGFRDGQGVIVPLAWLGAPEMLRHVRIKD